VRRHKNVESHPYMPAFGTKIVADERPEIAGSPLRPADPWLLDFCRANWEETAEADYEWDLGKRGMWVRRKADGKMLRIKIGVPGDDGALASDVVSYVIRDSRVILLSEPGTERPKVVYLGSLAPARRIVDGGPPVDASAIHIL
jgi:hypothetical protein